jgi:hypothetical protein
MEFSSGLVTKNKSRLLDNRNQTDNQININAVKRHNTYIWLRSGNSLHQREKPLRGS